MPDKKKFSVSFGGVNLVGSASREERLEADPVEPGGAFRLLVVGDSRGQRTPATPALAARKPIKVDRDNFDAVLDKLGVGLSLALPGSDRPVALRFRELEDFHPDRIYASAEVFQALKAAGRDLDDPAKFDEMAARLGVGQKVEAPAPPPFEATTSADNINLLDQILAHTPSTPVRSSTGPWDAFLEQITAAHRIPGADPRRAKLSEALDSATTDLMRAILHHPEFQQLESLWRGLWFLTRRLETDGALSLWLLDASKNELAADLGSESPGSSASYKSLVEPTTGTAGGQPWATIVAAFTFSPEDDDLALLGHLAALGRSCGAPVLAGAGPEFVGCSSLGDTPDPDDWSRSLASDAAEAWDALRASPDAVHLGLAMPRFLLRQPYGPDGETIESFAFEEMGEHQGHESYLWGHPAIALAEMLGRAFLFDGWGMRLGTTNELDGLPTFVDRRGDEPALKPCAEALLSLRAAELILDRGIMPLLSLPGRDAVRLARWQSIASPAQALAGRWS